MGNISSMNEPEYFKQIVFNPVEMLRKELDRLTPGTRLILFAQITEGYCKECGAKLYETDHCCNFE